MTVTRLNDSLTLIAVGSFNPAIFQPEWFSKHELLSNTETADAKIEVIHPDAAQFATHWLNWQALRARISVSTTDAAQFSQLRDLVLGVLLLLPETPVTAFGINLDFHFRFQTQEECDEFAYRFAPPAAWEGLLTGTKLRRLHVECPPPPGLGKKFGVIMEPSAIADHGAYINLNTHMDADINGVIDVLKNDWDRIIEFSKAFGKQLKDLNQ